MTTTRIAEALHPKRVILVLILAVVATALTAINDDVKAEQITLTDNVTWAADGVVTCSAAGTDNGAYSLSGYKLPTTSTTYKINTSTFPTSVTATNGQAAIVAAFSTADAATSRTLFINGGTTTSKPGIKDGVNTVGFGTLGSGIVGQATAQVNNQTKLITEIDIVLSTSYTWSTNAAATGDCGGSSTTFDVQNIATHEAGHATGLNDKTGSADHAQTMFGSAAKGELYKRTLANGDKAGVVASYGP